MEIYKGIADYLKYITVQYKLDVCINDYVGFLYIDNQLASSLQPYSIHKNPFCMQVKSELWDNCLRMKRGIILKCGKFKRTFYGMCYCGMEEYIIPIICKDIVIGAICVGEFCTHKEKSLHRIKKVAKEYGFDPETMTANFNLSTKPYIYDIETINSLFGIVADYISSIYAALVSIHGNLNLKNARSFSSESYILSHAIEFIKMNFNSKISVKDIAAFCHCSSSYISHIFKRNMRVNLKAYINKVRIEHAKKFLLESDYSISQVASLVGFDEPNYFSNVFSDICGMYPSDYRKSLIQK